MLSCASYKWAEDIYSCCTPCSQTLSSFHLGVSIPTVCSHSTFASFPTHFTNLKAETYNDQLPVSFTVMPTISWTNRQLQLTLIFFFFAFSFYLLLWFHCFGLPFFQGRKLGFRRGIESTLNKYLCTCT